MKQTSLIRNLIVIGCCTIAPVFAQTPQHSVLIFYSCWANETQSINPKTNDVWIMPDYSGYPAWNWWAKPLYAATNGDGTVKNNYKMYFGTPETPNSKLLDWHAKLLSEAGIDGIVLDLTNGTQTKIVNGAKAICKHYAQRQKSGLPTPKIVLWVKDESTLRHVEEMIFDVYPSEIFLEYLGKKLVCANETAESKPYPAIPTIGIWANYTVRCMWGLRNDASIWVFKVASETPPGPFMYQGRPEQMCAPVATQRSVMTGDGMTAAQGAIGRQNGAYFNKYMDAAMKAAPTFLFIHSWNEWAAQNLDDVTPETPKFVDIWKAEYSADIEPMHGGHGWYYYDLMKRRIAEYKAVVAK